MTLPPAASRSTLPDSGAAEPHHHPPDETEDGSSGRIRLPLAAALAGTVLAALVAPAVTSVLLGGTSYESLARNDPGRIVSVLTATARAIADLASMASLGGLLTLLVIRPASGKRWMRLPESFEVRWTRIGLMVWALATALLVPLEAADSNGVSLALVAEPGALGYLVSAAYLPKAWLVAFAALVVAAALSYFAASWRDLLLPAALGILATVAPLAMGQLLVGPNHDIGLDAGVLQAVILQPVLGAVALAAAKVTCGMRLRDVEARRLALASTFVLPAAFVLELFVFWFKVAAPGGFGTPTSALEIARLAALAAASTIALAVLVRRTRIAGSGSLLLVALASLGVLVSALASVMARIPPPHYFAPFDVAVVIFGFTVDDPPDATTLATAWRLNLLFAAIGAAAVTMYLVAVAALRRRGDSWPIQRTLTWILGWAVVVVVTSSGLGRYSGADFAVHMGVHMTLNMLAPILLVLGGPITLALRALPARHPGDPAGPREWLVAVLHWPLARALQHPVLVFVVFIASYYALYFTPLFGEAMRFHWAHQLMNLHFLITGVLFYGLVVGVDRPPRPLPHIAKLGMTLAAMPFHAFFATVVMSSDTVIASEFYAKLDQSWMTDLAGRQYIGGGLAWAGSELPLIIVILALGVQWRRADAAEARRTDRKIDRGRDDDFDAYNALLARLEERRAPRAKEPTP